MCLQQGQGHSGHARLSASHLLAMIKELMFGVERQLVLNILLLFSCWGGKEMHAVDIYVSFSTSPPWVCKYFKGYAQAGSQKWKGRHLCPPPRFLWTQCILCTQTFIDFIMWSCIYVCFLYHALMERFPRNVPLMVCLIRTRADFPERRCFCSTTQT